MVVVAGWAVACLTAVRAVPQLVKVVRLRSGRGGVSAEAAAVNVALYVPWVVYAVATSKPAVLFANAAGAVVYTALTATAIRYGAPAQALVRPGLLAVGLAVAGVLGGPAAAAAATVVGPVMYGVPQIRDALRSASVATLSPVTLALCAVEVLAWGAYGLVTNDSPMIVYMGASAAVHVSTLVIWMVRRPAAAPAAAGA